jgi:hypothetical protein
MIAVHLFILAILLVGGFYTGRFLFWLLFLKDAPAYDEQENFYYDYQERQ